MGPRIPSPLSANEGAAQGISAKTDCGVHSQRNPARAARHHRATETERSWQVRCKFSPQKSELSGRIVRFKDAEREAACDSAKARWQSGDSLFADDQESGR